MQPYWSLPPFDAVMRENGDIVARGAQDMKCIGMRFKCTLFFKKKNNPLFSYLEALGKLKTEGWLPERSIHVTFVPGIYL